jgi:hypothetical protein
MKIHSEVLQSLHTEIWKKRQTDRYGEVNSATFHCRCARETERERAQDVMKLKSESEGIQVYTSLLCNG